MDQRTREFYDQAAKRAVAVGPYYAIGTIQGICENTEESAATKIEHISYLLDRLMEEHVKKA